MSALVLCRLLFSDTCWVTFKQSEKYYMNKKKRRQNKGRNKKTPFVFPCVVENAYINKVFFSAGDYHELYQWSIDEYKDFWETWWEFGRFVYSLPASQVVEPDLSISQIPRWFPGARLNFTENLLRFRDDKVAIYATGA